jgi:3-phosphoshikimate 1-carboxyvinyltransferase
VTLDFTECPDLAQTLVVTLCLLGLPFVFTGLQTLKIKETDRMEALCTEMRKLGITIEQHSDDTLAWDGTVGQAAEAPAIDTYHDHRMAMSMAFAALRHRGIVIRDIDVVAKSYPGFWDDMRRAGFTLKTVE